MKRICLATIAVLIAWAYAPAWAYRLPPYTITRGDRAAPAEEVLARYEGEFSELERSVSLRRLAEHRRNTKLRLTPKERRAAKAYRETMVGLDFWKSVVGLKHSLLAMYGDWADEMTSREADDIAKTTIERLHGISQEYRVVGFALFHNFLVNIGAKKKGHCHHYVTDLNQALTKRKWQRFDLRWGVAYEGTFRENNALVITAKGRPFEEGLAIDAWRKGSRPFWIPVKKDRFPWVEDGLQDW